MANVLLSLAAFVVVGGAALVLAAVWHGMRAIGKASKLEAEAMEEECRGIPDPARLYLEELFARLDTDARIDDETAARARAGLMRELAAFLPYSRDNCPNLSYPFVWEDSPEGVDFWANLYDLGY